MAQEVVDRLLDPTQTGLFTMEPVMSLFSGAIQDPQDVLQKHRIFKPVSEAEKIRKPASRAPKKHEKSTLESPINKFCKNMVFAIPFMQKPCFKAPTVNNPTQNSMQKMTWKHAPKKQGI